MVRCHAPDRTDADRGNRQPWMATYLRGMSTEWTVAAVADQVSLNAQNQGTMTFNVTNPGPGADTVTFDVQPGSGSQRSWYSVEKPQRTVNPRQAVGFTVTVKAPRGTPAQRYDFTGLAYSSDTSPEESSRTSGRVFYEVVAGRKSANKLLPILLAAVVIVLVVAAVVTFLAWPSGSKAPAAGATPSAKLTVEPQPSAKPTTAPQKSLPPTIPDLRGTYHGEMVTLVKDNKKVYDSSEVTIVLTQDKEQLTGVLRVVGYPANYVGSGTATAAGHVTLNFDILGPFTLVGAPTSPGRLTGTFTFSDGEYAKGSGSGTWDVCTCVS